MWGGRTEGYSKNASVTSVHHFNPVHESWAEHECSGQPPPWLYWGASASAGHLLYQYGGYDGSDNHSSLYQLNTASWEWSLLSREAPRKKAGCGMLTYDSKLVLFGGYGDGGYTNELHLFDLKEGEGVSLAVSVELTCWE